MPVTFPITSMQSQLLQISCFKLARSNKFLIGTRNTYRLWKVLPRLYSVTGAERVAVRSSANSEDLEKVSGAGLHDSVLGVDIKDATGA